MSFKLSSRSGDPWELTLPSRKWDALHEGLGTPLSSSDQLEIPAGKLLTPRRPLAESTDPSGFSVTLELAATLQSAEPNSVTQQ